MRIRVDRQVCIGAGMCVLTDPELFDQDTQDGRVLVSEVVPAEAHHELVREAVSLCPSGALSIDED